MVMMMRDGCFSKAKVCRTPYFIMSNDNKQAKMKEGVYKSFSQVVLILAKFPADFELVHSFFSVL